MPGKKLTNLAMLERIFYANKYKYLCLTITYDFFSPEDYLALRTINKKSSRFYTYMFNFFSKIRQAERIDNVLSDKMKQDNSYSGSRITRFFITQELANELKRRKSLLKRLKHPEHGESIPTTHLPIFTVPQGAQMDVVKGKPSVSCYTDTENDQRYYVVREDDNTTMFKLQAEIHYRAYKVCPDFFAKFMGVDNRNQPTYYVLQAGKSSLRDCLGKLILRIDKQLELIINLGSSIHALHNQGFAYNDDDEEEMNTFYKYGYEPATIDITADDKIIYCGPRAARKTVGYRYQSPELILDWNIVHDAAFYRASNTYTYGVMVNEILTGSAPFPDHSEWKMCHLFFSADVNQHTPPLIDKPPYLNLIVAKLLKKNPNDRCQIPDALDFFKSLLEIIKDLPVLARLPENRKKEESLSPLEQLAQKELDELLNDLANSKLKELTDSLREEDHINNLSP